MTGTIQTHRQPSGAGCGARWCTWVKAADYYADNLIEVKKIVNEFEGDGILVKRAKEVVNDASIAASLLKIKRVIRKFSATKNHPEDRVSEIQHC